MFTIRVICSPFNSFNCLFNGEEYTAIIDGKFYEASLLSQLAETVTNLPFPGTTNDDLLFEKPDAIVDLYNPQVEELEDLPF